MLFGRRRRAEAAMQREAADRVEIIGLLLEVKGQMDRIVSLLEGSAKVPKGATDHDVLDDCALKHCLSTSSLILLW